MLKSILKLVMADSWILEWLNLYKAKVLEDLNDAVDELNMVHPGKLEARNADG